MRNRIVHHPMLDSAFIQQTHVDNDIAPLPRHKVSAVEKVLAKMLRLLKINAPHIRNGVRANALVLGTNNKCCLVHDWFINEWFKV